MTNQEKRVEQVMKSFDYSLYDLAESYLDLEDEKDDLEAEMNSNCYCGCAKCC